ncbi:MAG: TonB-dependent receptor [Alphaproteobacteria bacterium]
MTRLRYIWPVAAVLALLPAAAGAQSQSAGPDPEAPPTLVLPPIEVIGTTPLPGTGIDRDKVPSNVQSLTAPDISKQGPAALSTELDQRLGSVNINSNQDNPFQPDIQYRGFEASPVLGTPIGVAVYQNGIRLNEPFGDNLNWDLVPDIAVNRASVIPSNPVYGLNALGGALVLDMKNGFNFQGGEAEASGGSFGRRQFTLQYGRQTGNFGVYIAGNAYNDDGFRAFSPSQVRQLYADIGVEGERGGLHLNVTGADNYLSGVGPTPIQLVDIDRSAVFTSPQTFHNTLVMPSLNGDYFASDTLSFQGNVYLRSAARKVVNGNTTDAQLCADPTLLCLGDDTTPLIDTSGAQVPSSVLGGGIAGENDNSSITSLGLGGSLQGTERAPLFAHDNNLVVGASLDHADVSFNSTNELGIIDPSTLAVTGLGIIIDQPDGSLAPVDLETTNSYYGLYATDTFDVTSSLSATVGGRYNLALIHLIDKIGTALNGESRYSRFNPSAGATYKITPNVTGYIGYAEANRAPTAGEIACSNPARPCSLDNFLTSDPPGLKQVTAHTYEAGLRGQFRTDIAGKAGRVDWNLGLFRTDLTDDILNVPSAIISSGFFENVGNTRRQGIESGIGYRDDKWQVGASYSLVDATFQSPITLSSPNNPFADASGNIEVRPGDQLPGIPKHRLKLDADYALTDKWTVGGGVIVESGQYYFGDESNQNPKLGGFYVMNLRSSYRITDGVELFVLVENLTDSKYATYGIFGDVTKTPLPGVANPSDPRFVSVAPPLAAYGGIRIRF